MCDTSCATDSLNSFFFNSHFCRPLTRPRVCGRKRHTFGGAWLFDTNLNIQNNFCSFLQTLGPRSAESNSFHGATLARFGQFVELSTSHGHGSWRHVITRRSSCCSLFSALSLSGNIVQRIIRAVINKLFLFYLDKWSNVPTQPIQPSSSPSTLTPCGLA